MERIRRLRRHGWMGIKFRYFAIYRYLYYYSNSVVGFLLLILNLLQNILVREYVLTCALELSLSGT